MEAKPAFISLGRSAVAAVSIGPGLITFTRIPRLFKSFVQLRAKERIAAADIVVGAPPGVATPQLLALGAIALVALLLGSRRMGQVLRESVLRGRT